MATTTTTTSQIEALNDTWTRPSGVIGWLSQVNHKAIAVRFIVTAFFFFSLAGIASLIMRLQLAQPELRIISPELYNQLFTTHGTTMMFLFAIPVLEAVGMYFVPLMIGSRDLAFPRLGAFGYWVYLIAGLTVWIALFTGNGPDAAWFNYVPLASSAESPGLGIDVWTTAITFMEIATLVASVELIVTIFKQRAKGMSLNRMPLFVWAILVMSFMIVFAMPPVMLASVMLLLDRVIGTHFFNVAAGGDPLLWQHLFWIFGHPEVYIIFIPALGIISVIVSTFTRRSNVAYTLIAASFVSIGILSFGLWVHHMFTTGLPWLSLSFFEAASMSIAIPTGILIFSWIGTIWGTRPVLNTPFLFILGFFFIFIIGGITGVMVAAVPFNEQVHDTYFVVAHFHYVIIGGSVFPLIGGIYYWFPKIVGRMMSEGWGKISFWTMLIGFNVAFFPMHIAGMMGMPRQVYTYRAGLGWDIPNLISSIGAFIFGVGIVISMINAFMSRSRGARAGANPWGAGTLEWSVPSPPPQYNFAELPVVTGRYPLWPDHDHGPADPGAEALSLSQEEFPQDRTERETPMTRLFDSKLERRVVVATSSIWPLLTALSVAVLVLGSMFNLWFVPVGAVLAYISVVGWLWPRSDEWTDTDEPEPFDKPSRYGVTARSTGWWAILLLVFIELTVFTGLIASYFYLFANATVWPPDGISAPSMGVPLIYTAVLLASGILAWIGDRDLANGNMQRMRLWRGAGIIALIVFLVLKVTEYSQLPYQWDDNAYSSIVWLIAGFHTLHVTTVLLKEIAVQALAWRGFFNETRRGAVEGATLYWIFVVVMWIPLFATVYLFPNYV